MTTRFPSALFRARTAVFAATLLCTLSAQAAETPRTTTGSRIPERTVADLDDIHVIGAINDPADARVPDDTALPALPAGKSERREQARTGSRIPARPVTDLDDVHVIGAVEDPADAAHAEDTSLPALPVVSAPRGR